MELMAQVRITPCRGCGQPDCKSLGTLPDRWEFAGAPLPAAIPGGHLYRCVRCRLVFRAPILTAEQYSALYAPASAGVWASNGSDLRHDQRLVNDYIASRLPTGARVLDIGCFTGTLLSALPEHYQKFGIEKSEQAAQVCAAAGIAVIGDDLYALGEVQEKFDAIVAMDVIEHTVNPDRFLKSVLELLNDGGMVLITTGDSGNFLWQRFKSSFWYCSFAEHISFISREWLKLNAIENNYTVAHLQLFAYETVGLAKKLTKLLLLQACRLFDLRPKAYWSAHVSRDHLFAVIKRA